MIKSFLHTGLERFFVDGAKRGIQPNHANKISRILDRLDAANDIRDMRYPGSGLHKLEPKTINAKKQIWSVIVSGNWRITFKFFEKHIALHYKTVLLFTMLEK